MSVGEFEGAEITRHFKEVDGQEIFQCFQVTMPDGSTRMVPKCDGNADYERLKIWNAARGNPLNLE